MKFYEDLFLSDKIKVSKEEMIEKIENDETLFHTYLIVVPLHQIDGQLEIFHVEISRQALIDMGNYLVVGLALGKADAMELVHNIIAMVYEETKDLEIKKYFINRL